MDSVFSEVRTLRAGRSFELDRHNSNRYRMVACNEDGTKTAYYFGVPIYAQTTGRLVDLHFYEEKETWKARGSREEVTVAEGLVLENEEGRCHLSLPGEFSFGDRDRIRYGAADIRPTFNGICIQVPIQAKEAYRFILRWDNSSGSVRANDRCFSLMKEELRPFVTVSCMGVSEGTGRLTTPGRLTYQKYKDTEYALAISHSNSCNGRLCIEINLYEDKLFQDTTVESQYPDTNNAFGGTAFIGNTATYGEQWLYIRPDLSKVPELNSRRIEKAVLHFPYHGGDGELTAWKIAERFCSFGSKWNHRIPASDEWKDVYANGAYRSLDVTDWMTDSIGFLRASDGWILKPKTRCPGFAAISIGDSFAAPLLWEVTFRK